MMNPYMLSLTACLAWLISSLEVNASILSGDAPKLAPDERAAAKLHCSITPKKAKLRDLPLRAIPRFKDATKRYGKVTYFGLRGYKSTEITTAGKELLTWTTLDHALRFDFWECKTTYAGYKPQSASSKNNHTDLMYGQVRVHGSKTKCVTALSPYAYSTNFTVAPCVTTDDTYLRSQLFVHVDAPKAKSFRDRDYYKWLGGTRNATGSKLGEVNCAIFFESSFDKSAGHMKSGTPMLNVNDASICAKQGTFF